MHVTMHVPVRALLKLTRGIHEGNSFTGKHRVAVNGLCQILKFHIERNCLACSTYIWGSYDHMPKM